MTVTELLKSIWFVVDQDGKPTAAMLDMDMWDEFLTMLEDVEDARLVRERTTTWRTKAGWHLWKDFEAELDADALQTVD